MDVQCQYKRGQGVVYVMCHYGMAVWGQGLHQELWYVVDGNVINSALHGEKKVVVWTDILSCYPPSHTYPQP